MRTSKPQFWVPILGGLFLATFLVLKPYQPTYQGKRLSCWLNELRAEGGDAQTVANAVRKIGAKALPTLVRMLKTKDSRAKKWLMDLAGRQSIVQFHFTDAYEVHEMAVRGFEQLEPETSIPALLKCLTDSDAGVREAAVRALGKIHQEAQVVIPALVGCIEEDETRFVKICAGESLGNFGGQAKSVIPHLLDLLKSEGEGHRSAAALALGGFMKSWMLASPR